MNMFRLAPLAAASLLCAAPAAAQDRASSVPPPPPAVSVPAQEPDLQAITAFMGEVSVAMELQTEGARKMLEAKPLLDGMTDPAAARAGAPRVRAMFADARAKLARADGMLAALRPPVFAFAPGYTPASVIAEGRSQNVKVLALLDDYDRFLGSLEKGDQAAVRRLAPRLLEGSFVLLDSSAVMFRNRQAAITREQSLHQVLGIPVQLYRAMAIVGRGWVSARFGILAPPAEAALRADLAAVARESRALSHEGRSNLAREVRYFETRAAEGALPADVSAMLPRLRSLLKAREALFDFADEIGMIAESGSSLTRASLAAQPNPQLIGVLAPLEVRFQSALAEQAAVAGGKVP